MYLKVLKSSEFTSTNEYFIRDKNQSKTSLGAYGIAQSRIWGISLDSYISLTTPVSFTTYSSLVTIYPVCGRESDDTGNFKYFIFSEK